jgi:hypothetical protein
VNEERLAEISAWYIRFADAEARGRSPLYEELARAVAGDRETLGFLATLPDSKRQPNLLLAAVLTCSARRSDGPSFAKRFWRVPTLSARLCSSARRKPTSREGAPRCSPSWRGCRNRWPSSRWEPRQGSALCPTSTATTTGAR